MIRVASEAKQEKKKLHWTSLKLEQILEKLARISPL